MPNYCTNNLTVTGDAKEIKRFHEAITAGELQDHEDFRILDNLFPTPKELSETPKGHFGEGTEKQLQMEAMQKANLEKFGAPDWYEWNCKNYGSKWSDFDGVIGQVSDNEINLTFMSAWSPIGEGIRNVSKQFPTLDFVLSYDEGGMAFCGGYAFRNGEIMADIEGEYPSMTVEQSENEEYDEFYEQVSEVTQEIENQCRKALGVSV
jgi:hypothetical protein